MSDQNRMGDWFRRNYGNFRPFGESGKDEPPADEEDLGFQDFELTLSFPQPPDNVWQSIKLVNGRLVVTFEFVFDDVTNLESGEDDEGDT
ncbi:MAG: hypothetical protein ACM3VX_08700 [Bacteroidota bacterium]